MQNRSKYQSYKSSNIEWIGEIPSHWDVLPNRALFRERIERDSPDAEMLSVTIGRGVISQQSLLENSSKKDSSNLDKSSYKMVYSGDLAYNKMRAWQGAIGVSNFEGIVSPAYIIQTPMREQEPRYLHFLYRTPSFAAEAERWSYGITSDQWSLRSEHFKMIYSPLPPLDEQRAIADYLDRKDAEITRFIESRRRMIALLEEKKQAIINQAVTRGLDPSVPMKDSGVEWLGEIPAHWEVRRLKRGVEVSRTVVDAKSVDCRYIGLEHVGSGTGKLLGYSSSKSVEGLALCAHPGMVLFGKLRPYLAKVTDVPEFVVTSTEFLAMSPRAYASAYLQKLLISNKFIDVVDSSTFGAKMPRANWEFIGDLFTPLPPLKEQLAIAEHLEQIDQLVSRQKSRMGREIELMQEYRTRLISDVVTGKVRVE